MRSVLLSGVVFLFACSDDGGATGTGGGASASTGAAVASSTGADAQSSSASGSTTTSSSTGQTSSSSGGGVTCQGKTGAAGDMDYTVDHDGDTRDFRVHAPPGYDGSVGMPVVLIFHGYTQTNDQIENVTLMTPAADAAGYVVVYAQGVSNSWNAGSCCGSAATQGVDDVGFVGAMIDAVDAAYCIDPKRVYAAGFSNGGMLSNRLACELSDRIAAIGPVAGPLAFDPCTPSRPVPMIEFHGTSDFIVPYNGGGAGGAVSAPENASFWSDTNGCGDTPTVTFDMGDALCETYGGCQADASVTLCTLDGGGHQWPGGMSAGPLGTVNMDISASAAMLEFFDAHPMP